MNNSAHLRHCPKHRKPLPCPHCELAAKPGQSSSNVAVASEPIVAEPDLAPALWTARSKPVKWDVLLHYCFDQQAGETKHEHCKCEERAERVPFDVAKQCVKDGLADWLIVKNARSKTGTSLFRRAIVIRSVVIDGQSLFAVSSNWKSKRLDRAEKHEAIRVTIRDKANNLLRKMFAKGVISHETFQTFQVDAELDSLFTDPVKFEKFSQMLGEQKQHWFQKRFTEVLIHWWNNVLGYGTHEDTGTIMKQAPTGVGKIVYKPNATAISDAVRGNSTVNPAIFIPDPFGDQEDQFVDNGGRRVVASGHVAQPWDPAGGTDPRRFESSDRELNEDLTEERRSDGDPDEDLGDSEGASEPGN